MKCKICNKSYKSPSSLGSHLRVHNITSKEYYNKYLYGGTPICKLCGNETNYINITRGYSEYCSIKCISNSNEIKDKKKTRNR